MLLDYLWKNLIFLSVSFDVNTEDIHRTSRDKRGRCPVTGAMGVCKDEIKDGLF